MFSNKRSQSEFLPTLIRQKTSESGYSSSSAAQQSAAVSLSILSHSVSGQVVRKDTTSCAVSAPPPHPDILGETGRHFDFFRNKGHRCSSTLIFGQPMNQSFIYFLLIQNLFSFCRPKVEILRCPWTYYSRDKTRRRVLRAGNVSSLIQVTSVLADCRFHSKQCIHIMRIYSL